MTVGSSLAVGLVELASQLHATVAVHLLSLFDESFVLQYLLRGESAFVARHLQKRGLFAGLPLSLFYLFFHLLGELLFGLRLLVDVESLLHLIVLSFFHTPVFFLFLLSIALVIHMIRLLWRLLSVVR